MALDATAVETAPESEETPIEQPVEALETPETEAPESPDAEPEKVDAPDEVKPEEAVETESTPEPVTFDATSETLVTQVNETLDKYELPAEIMAAFDALKAKVAAAPADTMAEYADYGDADAVKTLLDRQAYLDSVSEPEPGQFRLNTDKFAQEIHKSSPDKASWLYFDLAQLPSDKYQGLNKFEEGIADALAVEGDTVQSVIGRYHQAMTAMKSGAVISSDAPAFIPQQLREAYWSMSKREREELDSFAPELDRIEYDENNRPKNQDEPIRQDKLQTLAQIQKGIDGDKQIAQTQAQQTAIRNQEFQIEVVTMQTKFYDSFMETVTADVIKNVKFSDNPKMNLILANQNVSFLAQACEDSSTGERTRQTLNDSGITFDKTKAFQLQKDIETASVSLANARRTKDEKGNVLNQIEVNKATSQFKKTTEAWQAFAKDILDQEARLVSTGTAEAVKEAAEKIKIAPKARAATKGVGTQTKASNDPPASIPYGTPQWDAWYAKETLREREAKRARAYQ